MGMRTIQPLTITVEQAALVLGIGRSTAYELVRSGDLKCIRLRRRIVVPVAQLAESLDVDRDAVWDALNAEAPQPASPRRDGASKPAPARRRPNRTTEVPTLF